MKRKIDGDTDYNLCTRYSDERTGKRTGRIGNESTSGDDPNAKTVKMRQNTEKSSGDLQSLKLL